MSQQAEDDIKNLFHYIFGEVKAPLAAERYVNGIYDKLKELSYSAESYKIQTHKSFLQFGNFVRKINYKKMTVIYTVHGYMVYIHRIVPANTISEL